MKSYVEYRKDDNLMWETASAVVVVSVILNTDKCYAWAISATVRGGNRSVAGDLGDGAVHLLERRRLHYVVPRNHQR